MFSGSTVPEDREVSPHAGRLNGGRRGDRSKVYPIVLDFVSGWIAVTGGRGRGLLLNWNVGGLAEDLALGNLQAVCHFIDPHRFRWA